MEHPGHVGGTVETAPDRTPTPEPDPPVAPGAAPSCLDAGVSGQEVLAQLRQAVPALAALDATALRQIVERLEPLQADLERAVAACREATAPPGGPTG